MRKSLYFLGRFNTVCGVSTYTEQLAEGFLSNGWTVEAFASDHSKIYKLPSRAPIKNVPCFSLWSEDGSLCLVTEEIKRRPPGALHIQHEHGIFRNIDALIKLQEDVRRFAPSVKIIATLHTLTDSLSTKMAEFLSNLDGIIIHTERGKAALSRMLSFRDPIPIRMIPHGMLKPVIKLEKQFARHLLGLPENENHIVALSLGFIHSSKQHMVMLQVLGELIKTGKISASQITLLIAGLPQPANSGGMALVNRLESYAKEIGISKSLSIHPIFVSDKSLNTFYSAADFCLHCRKGGGYSSSGSIRMDLSHKMPVLTSRSGITSDLPNDVVCFYDSDMDMMPHLEMIINDAQKRYELSQNARDYANQHTWDNTAKKHISFYETIDLTSRGS